MRMLLCTIGSKRRKGTLRFGAEVARALTADTTLLGTAAKGQMDAHLKRAAYTGCTSAADTGCTLQVMGRDAQRWWW